MKRENVRRENQKNMKAGKCIILLLMMLAFVMLPVNAQAASKKAKALKAYGSYMAGMESGSKFAVLYLNNDSVPELIYAVPNQFIYRIYTWKSGKMKRVLNWNYSQNPSNGYDIKQYYKKKGVIVADGYTGAVGMEAKYYFIYNGKKYKEKLCKTIYFGNTSYMKKQGSGMKSISASQFKKLLKNAVGSKKATKIKFYSNSAANRAKYLK